MEAQLCGRVGCGEPLVAVMLMSPQDTQAWLVGPDHEFAAEGVGLCGVHADRITVPFGWTLDDDRPAKPKRRRKKAAPSTASEPAPTKAPAAPAERSEPGQAHEEAAAELVSEPFDDDYVAPEDQFREPEVAVGNRPDESADDDSPRLSVVAPDEEAEPQTGIGDEEQPALWDEPTAPNAEPDESTPLLQRAFRVVRDD